MATTRKIEFKFVSNAYSLYKQFDKIDDKTKEIIKDFKKIGSGISSAGKSMTKSFTLPIVAGLGLATKNASDLTEAMSANEFVFKSASKQVEKFANTAAKSLGKSKREALDAVAGFGAMGTSMGQTEEAAADMGIELTKRAADLTSLRNLQKGVADTALKGIYTGETESLKGLGVVMTQTNLELFLVEKGQAKNVKEARKMIAAMNQQKKVMLRYNFVMEKTAGSQGNFEETSGDMANSLRIAKASFEDAGASLGEALLPMLTDLVNKVTKVVNWFAGLTSGQKKVITTVLLLVAVIGPLLMILGSVVSLVSTLVAVSTALNIAMLPLIGIILLIVAAFTLVIAVILKVVKHWDIITEVMQGGVEIWLYKINTFIDKVKSKFNSFKNYLVYVWKVMGEVITGSVKNAINGVVLVLNKGIGFINLFLKGINAVIRAINKVSGVNLPTAGMIKKLPSLAIGTNEVQSDGLANIHKGEAIVPANVVKGGFSGNYGVNSNVGSNSSNMINVKIEQTPIVIQMNDRNVASAILPALSKQIKIAGGNI